MNNSFFDFSTSGCYSGFDHGQTERYMAEFETGSATIKPSYLSSRLSTWLYHRGLMSLQQHRFLPFMGHFKYDVLLVTTNKQVSSPPHSVHLRPNTLEPASQFNSLATGMWTCYFVVLDTIPWSTPILSIPIFYLWFQLLLSPVSSLLCLPETECQQS